MENLLSHVSVHSQFLSDALLCCVLLWCGWKYSCALSTVHVTLRICVPLKETLACHATEGEALRVHWCHPLFNIEKCISFFCTSLRTITFYSLGFRRNFDRQSIKANIMLCNLVLCQYLYYSTCVSLSMWENELLGVCLHSTNAFLVSYIFHIYF